MTGRRFAKKFVFFFFLLTRTWLCVVQLDDFNNLLISVELNRIFLRVLHAVRGLKGRKYRLARPISGYLCNGDLKSPDAVKSRTFRVAFGANFVPKTAGRQRQTAMFSSRCGGWTDAQ